MKLRYLIASICLLSLFGANITAGDDPESFVIKQTKQHDIVFFGTTYHEARILDFIARVLPQLAKEGATHVGLEIASDQQV